MTHSERRALKRRIKQHLNRRFRDINWRWVGQMRKNLERL